MTHFIVFFRSLALILGVFGGIKAVGSVGPSSQNWTDSETYSNGVWILGHGQRGYAIVSFSLTGQQVEILCGSDNLTGITVSANGNKMTVSWSSGSACGINKVLFK